MSDDRDLAAGDFSSWLAEVQRAIRDGQDTDVPCDGCTACCTSSQFIHIGPDEIDTLSRIPSELLFAAPGLPRGNVLLGYNERGHCPMLIDNTCSIYAHRPRTCRTYDCRIFPASGVELDDEDKTDIAQRARRWRFEFPTKTALRQRDAVHAAATFIEEHPDMLPDDAKAANGTQRAVLAIELHGAFLRERTPDDPNDTTTSRSRDDLRQTVDIDRGRDDIAASNDGAVAAAAAGDPSGGVTANRRDTSNEGRDDTEGHDVSVRRAAP